MTKSVKLNRLVVALDISSSNVGWALKEADKKIKIGAVANDRSTGDYRDLINLGGEVVCAVHSVLEADIVGYDLYVFAEQPFYVSGKSTPAPIFMMHGILLTMFHRRDPYLSWQEVSVSTWRNWLLKKHNATVVSRKSQHLKALTSLIMSDSYGITHDSQDAIDAAGILTWALEHLDAEQS